MAAPAATTGSATDLAGTSVTLHGLVDAGGTDTGWYFDIEPVGQTSPLSTEVKVVPGSTTGPVPVSAPVVGLAPGTTYRYTLEAVDGNGDASNGGDLLVTTPPLAPTTLGVSQIAATSALLGGVISRR